MFQLLEANQFLFFGDIQFVALFYGSQKSSKFQSRLRRTPEVPPAPGAMSPCPQNDTLFTSLLVLSQECLPV